MQIQLLLLGSVNVSYSQLVCAAVGFTWLLLILVYGHDWPFITVKKYLQPSQCYKESTSHCYDHVLVLWLKYM